MVTFLVCCSKFTCHQGKCWGAQAVSTSWYTPVAVSTIMMDGLMLDVQAGDTMISSTISSKHRARKAQCTVHQVRECRGLALCTEITCSFYEGSEEGDIASCKFESGNSMTLSQII